MKNLRIIIIAFLTTSLSSCSWISSFYIINDTDDNIIITYKLLPMDKNDYEYAVTDSVEFYNLIKDSNGDINRIKTINSPINGKYSKRLNDNQLMHTITLAGKTAITFGNSQLFNFSYGNFKKRHEIFENIIEMKIYRMDSNESVTLTKSMLADLSRPFEEAGIALIFD